MTVKAYDRGHPIELNESNEWVYSDTKTICKWNRPCIRCNRKPTQEGHDSCLGTLKDVKSACCGHGIIKKFVIMLLNIASMVKMSTTKVFTLNSFASDFN